MSEQSIIKIDCSLKKIKTMTKYSNYCLLFFLLFLSKNLHSSELNQKPYVIGTLEGQAGNIFFQIATASALAWDNGAEAYFPQLAIIPSLYHHYFSRCKITPPSDEISYHQGCPTPYYAPLSYRDNMKTSGFFQSWKYFDHHRDRLISLFSPIKRDAAYIEKQYGTLLKNSNTVGIQLRYYMKEAPSFAQFGRDYFEKAMKFFPDTSVFIVSSNNIAFAKDQIPTEGRTVIFLEKESDYIDFHLLTRCNHNIISNSTFGWWIAYLNQNPDKIIICPAQWFGPTHWGGDDYSDIYPDIYPESWIQVKADRVIP